MTLRRLVPWALTAAGLGLALLGVLAVPAELGWAVVGEDGPVEGATALLLAAGAGAAGWVARRERWWSGHPAAILLLAAAMRELDFHRRFTTVSVERGLGLSLLTSAAVPWPEKLVVTAILLGVAAAAAALAVREWRPFLRGLRARRPPALALLVAGAAVGLAQAFDKTYGGVRRAVPELALPWKLTEESLELAAAILVLLALLGRHWPSAPPAPGAPRRGAGSPPSPPGGGGEGEGGARDARR